MGRVITLGAVRMVVVVLIVSFATMAMIRAMGTEPAYAILGQNATPEQVEAFNQKAGLDQPLLQQWASWIGGWFRGDLGTSLRTNEPITEILLSRFPVTLELAVLAAVLALVIAIPLGIYTAAHAGGRLDRFIDHVSSLVVAIPGFVLALLLVYVFSLQFGLLPVAGWVPFFSDPLQNIRYVILPVITLAAIEGAIATRVLRTDMIGVLREDFILAARAQGIRQHTMLWRHGLRPASLSLLTVAGVSLGRLLGGTVLVEVIFAMPGIGQALVQGVYASDIFVVQGLAVFLVVCVVVINFVVDALYPVVDPRVGRASKRR